MQWVIVGAEEKTGRDIRIDVEADNQEAAERKARERGILVASVRRMAEVVDYQHHRDAIREEGVDIRGGLATLASAVFWVLLVVSAVLVLSGCAAFLSDIPELFGYDNAFGFSANMLAKIRRMIEGGVLMMMGYLTALFVLAVRAVLSLHKVADGLQRGKGDR